MKDFADTPVASFRAGFAGALMIDRGSEEHLIALQEAFFRAAIDHQCGRRPRNDATSIGDELACL